MAEFEFSGHAKEALDKTAAQLHITNADVLRNALATYAHVIDNVKASEKLVIMKEGRIEKTILVPGA